MVNLTCSGFSVCDDLIDKEISSVWDDELQVMEPFPFPELFQVFIKVLITIKGDWYWKSSNSSSDETSLAKFTIRFVKLELKNSFGNMAINIQLIRIRIVTWKIK